MLNLVGPEGLARWDALLGQPGVAPHLYGKAEAREGRKLGHATRLLALGSLAGLPESEALSGF
jgi:5-(carboxyamino)imidazole ribonucleotide synthase